MTMWVLCKDCWLKHDSSTLLCRCKQCDANSQVERTVPLESKSGAGPFPRSGPLVCTNHKRPEPLDIYCGTCRTELSPRALIDERGVVALAGDRKSGKTSLLWVLNERLRQHNDGGIYIRQALGDSDKQMAKAVHSILSDGRVAATSKTDANVRNYAWEVVLPSGETTVIAFHDAAGEVWNTLAKLPRAAFDHFYGYLDLAGSIIFTIDGERLSESISAGQRAGVRDPSASVGQSHEIEILDAIARRLEARKEKLPLMAVVTKADMLWGSERWSSLRGDKKDTDIDATVRALLRAAGRQGLVDSIDQRFAPVRFFAVSAFGAVPRQPLRIEDLRPARVEEPLLALLAGMEARN